jgi:hypothetical protein
MEVCTYGLRYSLPQPNAVTYVKSNEHMKQRDGSTVEPGYNDSSLYDTSYIASDILRCQSVPHC